MAGIARPACRAQGAGTLLRTNQPAASTAPAAPGPIATAHSTFEFCENGVKAVAAEATSLRVRREFFADAHRLRARTRTTTSSLEAQGRLTEPMVYDAASDDYVPIAWDDAFALDRRAR